MDDKSLDPERSSGSTTPRVVRHTQPRLTTVHQPREMGHAMVELLLARIEGRAAEPRHMLAPHLVIRESSWS